MLHRGLFICGLIFGLLMGANAKAATKEELVAFVKEAAAYVHKVGNEKAFEEFSDPNGKFNRGELYIFVYEYGKDATSCINRAHGLNKGMIGRPACDLKDKKGNFANRDLMRVAKDGTHWTEFWWPHPQKRLTMRKIAYTEDLDGKYFIGSGIYSEEK